MSLPKKSRGDNSLFAAGVGRRSFFQRMAACSLAVAAVKTVEGRSISHAEDSKPMIDKLSLATFQSCIGNTFEVEAAGEKIEFELVEAVALPVGVRPATLARREPFSLVFRAPARFNGPQSTYELHHERLGRLTLFLVPIGMAAGSLRYEAIFN